MDLTISQYKRANKVMYSSIMVLCIIMAFANLGIVIQKHNLQIHTFLLLLFILSGIGVTICYLSCNNNKNSMYLFTGIWSIMTIIGVFSMGFLKTYAIGFTIIFASIAYINIQYTLIINALTIIIYICNILYLLLIKNEPFYLNSLVVPLLVTVIVSIISISITMLFKKLVEENCLSILDKVNEQQKIVHKITLTTNEVSNIFGTTLKELGTINDQIHTNRISMHNIAQSMDNTANEIQKQALSTNKIQDIIKQTENKTNNIKDTANNILVNVNSGINLSKTIQEHSKKVNDNTNKMSHTIQVLSGKVNDVSAIVETIVNISKQTNLLALNASIEASRTGEAGKGFGVVAEEIHALSENTRLSTNQISDIIYELTTASNDTLEVLKESVSSIQFQSENVETMNQNFLHTGNDISNLIILLNGIHNDINNLYTSNQIIVEGISQLSGTTEEVTAVSQEGVEISNTILTKIGKFNNLIYRINDLVKSLETLVKKEN